MSEALKVDVAKVPLKRETRIKELLNLTNKKKAAFLPPKNLTFRMGPFVYRVTSLNTGKLRFNVILHDVVFDDG